MNENLNLVEILADVPKGTPLYSPLFGDVELDFISDGNIPFKISVINNGGRNATFTSDGRFFNVEGGECLLFPSKDQRDWSKFTAPKNKTKTKITIHPLDPILVRDGDDKIWGLTFFAKESGGKYYTIEDVDWSRILPYTAETIPLVNTPNPCLVDYEIEFAPTPRVDVYK